MSFRVNTNVPAMNALRNLNATGTSLAGSINKLSTGLRINSAADDPAGLIASENFRAQISGVEQAIKNSQDALNYSKTAEGALDEISRLMRDARSLAVASANTGTLSSSQLQANQTQIDLITRSIDRIAQQTQFGRKKILDGSAGVNATVVNSTVLKSISLNGEIGSQTLTADGAVQLDVTTAATQATLLGTRTTAAVDLPTYVATAIGADGSFSINGTTINVKATDTFGDVVTKINDQSKNTGVTATAVFDGTNGQIQLQQKTYGSNFKVNLVDASGVILSAAGTASVTGTDAVATATVGTLNPVTFTGGAYGNDGLTLTDIKGNKIVLNEAGNVVGTYTAVAQVTVGTAQFQIGGNANQTTQLWIPNFSATALGFGGIDVTTADGATAAIDTIDNAIDGLNQKRGEIGSFMRNILQSNIRSLGVADENLSATESSIRDTDIASEMTRFTKYQILQQTGLSVLAQANNAPQSVLNLLR
ncbi:MAG TPA: flagellin [Fimbriimonadaceae bacterium]|nr:flagellin [Fimbriimonadaceae bacterium]